MRDEARDGTPRFRDMPKNVRRFTFLWCASLLIDLVVYCFVPVDTSDATTSPVILYAIAFAVLLAILLPPLWFAVWRRKNWARVVLVALFAVGLAALPLDPIGEELSFLDFGQIRTDQLVFFTLDALTSVMDAVALFFLFSGDARPWFGAPDPKGVASTFD
jgi:predicted cation transporter